MIVSYMSESGIQTVCISRSVVIMMEVKESGIQTVCISRSVVIMRRSKSPVYRLCVLVDQWSS